MTFSPKPAVSQKPCSASTRAGSSVPARGAAHEEARDDDGDHRRGVDALGEQRGAEHQHERRRGSR